MRLALTLKTWSLVPDPPLDGDLAGFRDAGVAARHRDGFEQVDVFLRGQLEAARAIDLSEDGEALGSEADHRKGNLRVDEVIGAQLRGDEVAGLGLRQAADLDAVEQREVDGAILGDDRAGAQIVLLENVDLHRVVGREHVGGRGGTAAWRGGNRCRWGGSGLGPEERRGSEQPHFQEDQSERRPRISARVKTRVRTRHKRATLPQTCLRDNGFPAGGDPGGFKSRRTHVRRPGCR